MSHSQESLLLCALISLSGRSLKSLTTYSELIERALAIDVWNVQAGCKSVFNTKRKEDSLKRVLREQKNGRRTSPGSDVESVRTVFQFQGGDQVSLNVPFIETEAACIYEEEMKLVRASQGKPLEGYLACSAQLWLEDIFPTTVYQHWDVTGLSLSSVAPKGTALFYSRDIQSGYCLGVYFGVCWLTCDYERKRSIVGGTEYGVQVSKSIQLDPTIEDGSLMLQYRGNALPWNPLPLANEHPGKKQNMRFSLFFSRRQHGIQYRLRAPRRRQSLDNKTGEKRYCTVQFCTVQILEIYSPGDEVLCVDYGRKYDRDYSFNDPGPVICRGTAV
tara:strand:- start:7459 stop:8451 length:993 start_codon:yes stop_codon:yes gene_type:complete